MFTPSTKIANGRLILEAACELHWIAQYNASVYPDWMHVIVWPIGQGHIAADWASKIYLSSRCLDNIRTSNPVATAAAAAVAVARKSAYVYPPIKNMLVVCRYRTTQYRCKIMSGGINRKITLIIKWFAYFIVCTGYTENWLMG